MASGRRKSDRIWVKAKVEIRCRVVPGPGLELGRADWARSLETTEAEAELSD